MNLQISWNPQNRREIDEAKTKYIKAKKAGLLVVDPDSGSKISRFDPELGCIRILAQELGENEFSFRVFDDSGDRRLIWNSKDPKQIQDAANLFDEYIKKGWKAYAVDLSGNRGRRIFGFNPTTEEVYFDDKLTSEKLKEFIKSWSQFSLLPRTYPG